MYALSESGIISFCPIDVVNPNTVGLALDGTEIKVVDPTTDQVLGPNQVGELYIRGKEVSPGYLNNPTANKENFTNDGFLKTGDALYYDDNGWFFIVDRYKEVIKCDSAQVAPAELESILLTHPSVAEVAVIGIPHDIHGQVPRAYVVLKPLKSTINDKIASELVKYVADNVGRECYHLKGGVEFVKTIPKIGMGKIDRVTLRKMVGGTNI